MQLFGGIIEEEKFVFQSFSLPFEEGHHGVVIGVVQHAHVETAARHSDPFDVLGKHSARALGITVGIIFGGFQHELFQQKFGIIAELGLAQSFQPHIFLTVDISAPREIPRRKLVREITVHSLVRDVRLFVHLDCRARRSDFADGDARHFPVDAQNVAHQLPAQRRPYPALDNRTLFRRALLRASVEFARRKPRPLELDYVGNVRLRQP